MVSRLWLTCCWPTILLVTTDIDGLEVFTYQGGINSEESVVKSKSVGETNDELICLMFCQQDFECNAIQFTDKKECFLLKTREHQGGGPELQKGYDFTIHASGINKTMVGPGKPACQEGEDKYLIMTLADTNTSVEVGLYSAKDWRLCRSLPTLTFPRTISDFILSGAQFRTAFSETHLSLFVNHHGLWELQLNGIEDPIWVNHLEGAAGFEGGLVVHEENDPNADRDKNMTLFAFQSKGVRTLDFEKGEWQEKAGQAFVKDDQKDMLFSTVPFQVTDNLVVLSFLGPGYAVYNISSQEIVSQRWERPYLKNVTKDLFFEIPLSCGRGRGLVMAENLSKKTQGEQKLGTLFYLDYDWIEEGDYRPIEVLNVNGLPEDFKKHKEGRVLTGHPDGPVLYNTRDNTLTYWSMKTNSFDGKKIRAPFNSKTIQGFYHSKLANIMSDTVPLYYNDGKETRDIGVDNRGCGCAEGTEKYLVLTIVTLTLVKVELYSADNWILCKLLPDLSLDQNRLDTYARQLMTEVSTKRQSVLVLKNGQLYELRLTEEQGSLRWEKLGPSDQLPASYNISPVIYEQGDAATKLFGFAMEKSAIYQFDFDSQRWNKKDGQFMDFKPRNLAIFSFKANEHLVVTPFRGFGYGVYDTEKEEVVKQRSPKRVTKVRKNLFFEIPLKGGQGRRGLAMAEEKKNEDDKKHGDLYYLDYEWIRDNDFRGMALLNSNGLPDDFKKNGLGRVLTGHPNGPILYNTRDNSLTYWSTEDNAFSGKRIEDSPFKSQMAQGFYHPMFSKVN